jgi:queuine tRNA-ribosyltransferase subunit QTRTD1
LFGAVVIGGHFVEKSGRGLKRVRDEAEEAKGKSGEENGDEARERERAAAIYAEKGPPSRRLTVGHYRDSMYFGLNSQARAATGILCDTPFGRKSMTPEEYSRIWSGDAHVACALADEHVGWESMKKSKTAAIRTCEWLDVCVRESKANDIPLWGVVLGGEFKDVRVECSKKVAERDEDLAGYVLGGFYAGETPSKRNELIQCVIDHLPAQKPRYLPGITTLEDIIDNIERGVDVFDATWASETASRGRAFVFPIRSEDVLDWNEETEEWNQPCATTGADAYSINIWSTAYKRDFSPFIDKTTRGDVCACPACTEHTRAYVHHLLQAHEMTSHVLLEAHNLFHLASFFAAARRALRDGSWTRFATFHRRYAASSRFVESAVAPVASAEHNTAVRK